MAGGNAGNGGALTIQGGTIASIAPFTTTGGQGGTGGGNAGGVGGAGGNSGNSGNVSLTATGNITVASITASGTIGGAAGASATGQALKVVPAAMVAQLISPVLMVAILAASSISATGGNGGFSRQVPVAMEVSVR